MAASLPPPHFLEARVFPPALTAALALANYFLGRADPPPLGLRTEPNRPLGAGLALAGLGLFAAAALRFSSRRTTINPFEPSEAASLVTDGIFGLTRNPMYLGMALIVAGPAAWQGQPLGALVAACFVGYITRFQIVPEERALYGKFGDGYAEYAARTARWIIF
ncbi:isoprenylcysteine carboxyl methyltransferase [Hyaloraphidium curvatum]|nr:isoprenylcysteine carboxyl methyltransferase [Hyaloraphidium curvatum]